MKEQSKRILLVLRQGYISTLNGESNDKDLKFEVDDDVRIWKYKNIFKKHLQKQSKNIYTPNCSEEVFVMKILKLIVTVPCACERWIILV